MEFLQLVELKARVLSYQIIAERVYGNSPTATPLHDAELQRAQKNQRYPGSSKQGQQKSDGIANVA
jgi:hypothetical protein